jgi:hypothetical protein
MLVLLVVKEIMKMDVKVRMGVLGLHKNVQIANTIIRIVVKIMGELGVLVIVLNKFVKPVEK